MLSGGRWWWAAIAVREHFVREEPRYFVNSTLEFSPALLPSLNWFDDDHLSLCSIIIVRWPSTSDVYDGKQRRGYNHGSSKFLVFFLFSLTTPCVLVIPGDLVVVVFQVSIVIYLRTASSSMFIPIAGYDTLNLKYSRMKKPPQFDTTEHAIITQPEEDRGLKKGSRKKLLFRCDGDRSIRPSL